MPPFISFRDVQFHPSTIGVRIIVTTDIPSHLWCRLTPEPPRIHKKPELRRGLAFAEDVRFCFTVFEDNEQYETGDTLEHTWWKENWDPCTTKYCYFWGYVAEQVSVSTSPFFKYHNDGIEPVPPPWENDMIFLKKQILTATGLIDLTDLDTKLYPILKLFFWGRCTSTIHDIRIRLNGYSGTYYNVERIYANRLALAQTQFRNQTAFHLGIVGGQSEIWKAFAEITLFNDYTTHKLLQAHTACIGDMDNMLFTNHASGRMTSVTIEYITRITITNDLEAKFAVGTQAILYGLKDP